MRFCSGSHWIHDTLIQFTCFAIIYSDILQSFCHWNNISVHCIVERGILIASSSDLDSLKSSQNVNIMWNQKDIVWYIFFFCFKASFRNVLTQQLKQVVCVRICIPCALNANMNGKRGWSQRCYYWHQWWQHWVTTVMMMMVKRNRFHKDSNNADTITTSTETLMTMVATMFIRYWWGKWSCGRWDDGKWQQGNNDLMWIRLMNRHRLPLHLQNKIQAIQFLSNHLNHLFHKGEPQFKHPFSFAFKAHVLLRFDWDYLFMLH